MNLDIITEPFGKTSTHWLISFQEPVESSKDFMDWQKVDILDSRTGKWNVIQIYFQAFNYITLSFRGLERIDS